MTDIERFIRDLNTAWLDSRFDDLYEYYDSNVVLLPPGAAKPIVGVELMVDSYRQFAASGRIHTFDIEEISLYHWDKTVICHLKFIVDYEVVSGRFQESGLEIYVVNCVSSGPKVVWRSQLTLDTSA